MSEENHKGWKLVTGVRRDVINLFKLFANTNSVRYEDFCKVWKETNFSLIFSNRNSHVELLEFSEEVLQIVKEYLFSVYEFHTRVAAMYALYGLYFKQPILGAAKIRFTKTEWEEVFSFIEKAKVEKHYDVAFTFIKLYVSGALSFTATIRPRFRPASDSSKVFCLHKPFTGPTTWYRILQEKFRHFVGIEMCDLPITLSNKAGLERGYKKYWEPRSTLYSKACDVELLYRPLISKKLVNSLVKLESLYCKKKFELLGKKNLVFIDGKFAESLQEELKNYELASQTQFNVKNKIFASTSEVEVESKVRDSTQLSSKRKRTSASGHKTGDEVMQKIKKFNRKHLKLMAKKKAEFYIRKLQLENNEQESSEKKSDFGLDALE